MAPVDVKKIVCTSCKGVGHKRKTNKLCPNSHWGQMKEKLAQMKEQKQIEDLNRLQENLKKFKDFVTEKNITMDKLAPAFCSNWMEIERYDGNIREWKLDYTTEKQLLNLHYDVASLVREDSINDIPDCVTERTKIIYGIVGSNAGETWYNKKYTPSYTIAHEGTVKLLKKWGVTVESKNITL